MNFHSDEWIMEQLERHYDIAKEHFKEDQIVGIFLQGSQNYDMDTKDFQIENGVLVKYTGYSDEAEVPYGVTEIGNNAFSRKYDERVLFDKCFLAMSIDKQLCFEDIHKMVSDVGIDVEKIKYVDAEFFKTKKPCDKLWRFSRFDSKFKNGK